METSATIGLREFWFDFRSILTSPARRFALIHDRDSLRGSLALMILPGYFLFTYAGGVYFDSDPFPGYSFVIPFVPAAVLMLAKAYLIHFFARLLEGNGNYLKGQGTFRGLLAVFGYTLVPSLLAFLVALLLFLLFPYQLGFLFHTFRVACISTLVAVGVALFVWALILTVLAMRTVYQMRDAKIVVAMFLGSIASGLPAFFAILPVAPSKVDTIYIEPILSERFMQFLAPKAIAPSLPRTRVSVHIDRIAYRFKEPKRFELVAFEPRKPMMRESEGKGTVVFRKDFGLFSEKEEIIGRIVGLPGDAVELTEGRLRINGQIWNEPYIPSEYQSQVSLPSVHLSASQCLVLPEDRRLVESHREELIVDRPRLRGRRIVRRWPLGWLEFRPTAFLHASPAP